MIFTRKFFKLCGILIVFLAIFNLVYIYTVRSRIEQVVSTVVKSEKFSKIDQKVSWEDLDFIFYERTRVGPGEHGEKVDVTDPEELKKNDEWVKKEGFFVEVSNKISVTRSLPDRRPEV